METHDFNVSVLVGNKGEKIIFDYLNAHPKVKQVDEVQNNKVYQKKDIDYIVHFNDGTSTTVELKTDTYKSGNIFFETMSAVEINSIGCMFKSEAKILFYYFTATKELYIINLAKYIEWFNLNKAQFNLKRLRNKCRKDGDYYTSEGYTIPKTFLESNFKSFKKIIIE